MSNEEKRVLRGMASRRELLAMGAAGLAGSAAFALEPPLPPAPHRPTSVWPAAEVRNFGAAGNGKADDTAAFQRALDAAHKAGGGTVYAPPGSYLFKGTLAVPDGVTLSGSYGYVPSHPDIRLPSNVKPGDDDMPHKVGTTPGQREIADWIRPGSDGTALLVTGGKGSEEGTPFLTLHSNASVCGLTIDYPEQTDDGEPSAYPWCITMQGANCAAFDMELLNPYQGINATGASRHNIRNLTGQPLRRGILVDAIYDIGRIEDVHFNATWSWGSPAAKWQLANGECFIFGRSDWEYVFNTFCLGYKAGYKFIQTATGECNGNFLGIGADACNRSVVVEQSAPYALLITNGEFVADMGDDPTMVEVLATNKGVVRFHNSSFWGPCNQIAKIDGAGTVGFSDCTFVQWGHQGDRAAIQASGGSVLVRGCEFLLAKQHIQLGERVERAVISENLFSGPAQIENASKNNIQIGLNSASA